MTRGTCPNCEAELDGDEIPGLPGRTTDRRIPIELTYKHKGITVIWRCPDCGHGWPRFEDGPMHDTAVSHLAGETQREFERAPTGDRPGRRRKAEPLPDVDPDRRNRGVPLVARAGDPPPVRGGVQRAGASTGTGHQRR